MIYICLYLPHRCQALQHPGQLSRGDQAVRLWRERPAHRFHGQLLCWNALLHVGESALHACAPTPFSLALSPLSFSSFLTLLLFTWPRPLPCLPLALPHSPAKSRGLCPGKGSLAKREATVLALSRPSFPSLLDTLWVQCRKLRACPILFPSLTHKAPVV